MPCPSFLPYWPPSFTALHTYLPPPPPPTAASRAISTPRLLVILCPPPGGIGRGRPADAAGVAPALLEPLLGAERQLAVELVAGVLAVDEVAEAAADAALARVEAAAGLAEVGDGAELAVDGARGVPAAVELVAGGLGRLLVLEAGVDVADQVLRENVSITITIL